MNLTSQLIEINLVVLIIHWTLRDHGLDRIHQVAEAATVTKCHDCLDVFHNTFATCVEDLTSRKWYDELHFGGQVEYLFVDETIYQIYELPIGVVEASNVRENSVVLLV